MIAFTPEQLVPWIYFNLGVKYVGVYHHQHGDVVTKWPTEYRVERLAFEDSSGDIYVMADWALKSEPLITQLTPCAFIRNTANINRI